MAKIEIACGMCGKLIMRYPSQLKDRNFCGRACLGRFNSKAGNPEGYRYRSFEKNSVRMAEMNREMNPRRMTLETREKLSAARFGTGSKGGYLKKHGRHIHRTAAEEKMGRALLPGEIVHHIDGDKQNNSPDNLDVLPSQSVHAKRHIAQKRGDA